ncbi:unnamed protein product [Ixodes persulcatus]
MGSLKRISERNEEDAVDSDSQRSLELHTQGDPGFKPVYVPLVLLLSMLATFLVLAAAVYIRDAVFGEPTEPPTLPWGVRGPFKSRTSIRHGHIFCVVEPSVTPTDFKLPPEGICDAIVYCCLVLNFKGIHFENGSDVVQRFDNLVALTSSWKSSPTGFFGIVGRRADTPKLRNLPGALSREALLDLMVSWVKNHQLNGLFMDLDNSANGYYYKVMRLFYRKLRATGRWLIQIFDFNDANRKFSAGAYTKSAMGPVVRSSHDSLKEYVDNAVCPMPYRSHDEIIWNVYDTMDEYASVNFASFGSEYLEDTMLTMSFKGYHYRLNNSAQFEDESPASRVGDLSYGTLCQLRNESGVKWKISNISDCLVVQKGAEWYSTIGPDATEVYKLFKSFLALIVYDLHFDDYAGICGTPYPLLQDARSKVKKFSDTKEFQIS